MITKKAPLFFIFFSVSALLIGCKTGNFGSSKVTVVNHSVTGKQKQHLVTPNQILQQVKAGNERFEKSDATVRTHSKSIRKVATDGQYPKAMVLSCVDSKVPVEDVFVGRVAGNFVNTDLLASTEFACKVAGAKLIIVMGHQHCGAIKGAIDDVHLGNITAMLKHIKPAVAMSQNFEREKSSKNEAFVKLVAQNTVRNAIAEIRAKSEILSAMEENGEIKIVGPFMFCAAANYNFWSISYY